MSTRKYPTGVRRTSSGKIEIYFTIGPRTEKRHYSWTLDLSPTNNRDIREAKRIRDEYLEQVKEGSAPPQPGGGGGGDTTFAGLCAEWLDDAARNIGKPNALKLRTVNSYRSSLNTYWLPIYGGLPVRNLSPEFLRRTEFGVTWPSEKTRRNAHAALAAVLRWGHDTNRISSNPYSFTFRGTAKPLGRAEAYTASERDALLSWLAAMAPRRISFYYRLAFATGARTAELLALTWEKFDEHGFEINESTQGGKRTTTKTGASRYVPVTKEFSKSTLLFREDDRQAYPGHPPGDRTFIIRNQYHRGYTRADKINPWFHKACAEAGVKDLMGRHAPYPWRHTWETLAYQGEFGELSPWDIAEILGHSVETGAKHYKAHSNKDRLRGLIK